MISEPAVLLIEPDAATRELYRRELSERCRVISLPDVHHALDLLRIEHVDAIVLEPDLPGSLGWDFIVSLKATLDTARIPLIICSVLDERRRGKQLGVFTYLVKPVLPATLLDVLGHLQACR